MSTLALYRELLRVVSKWPSRNRLKIREEIRTGTLAAGTHAAAPQPHSSAHACTEFRLNRSETDAAKLEKMFGEARAGLHSMKTQIGWQSSSEIGNTSGVLQGIKPAAGE